MRHLKSGRRLGRNSAHRKAMYRNMATSLMLHGQIRTTEAKAKELRRVADRIITLGKKVSPGELSSLEGSDLDQARARRLHAIRMARVWIHDRAALAKVFDEYAVRFQARNGGYTRIVKAGFRPGDNAPMAIIELVGHSKPPVSEVGENADESGEE